MTTRTVTWWVAAGSLLVALVAAGCGGTEEDDGVASLDEASAGGGATATAEQDPEAAEAELLAYVECLRGEGLDVPDPSVDSEGNLVLGGPGGGAGGGGAGEPPDAEAFEAATEVCGEIPDSAVGAVGDLDSTEFEDAALAFAECMRENGVDVPDPDFSDIGPGAGEQGEGGGGGGPFGGALDTEDPAVAEALEQCEDIFADAGVGPGAGR